MLYTLSKAQYNADELTQWLAQITENDALVLWQDGVLQAVKNPELFANLPVFVLENDLNARGLHSLNSLPAISLAEFIILTEKHSPQITL